MYLKKLLLFILISSTLYSQNLLKKNYYIKNDYVMLCDIVKDSTKDVKLFQLEDGRYSLRIKSKLLIKTLKKYGYDYISKHAGYIQFTKKSPIDRKKFKLAIKRLYKQKYKYIKIETIDVNPNRYMQTLPKNYVIHFQDRTYLSNNGTLYIKTDHQREFFFHYNIKAKVLIFKAKNKIKRSDLIDNHNCKKNSIILDKFRAMPIQNITNLKYQAKHQILEDHIITTRDVTGVDLVKRGSYVNVSLTDGGIEISFLAKALRNGKLGNTIEVLSRNGRKVVVVVTGKNQVEVK